ncbi:MAG: hypothetical protein IT425_11665 [Pirellulales bacterium]|nr:hypothetical protein [Pirellulales bacterium]
MLRFRYGLMLGPVLALALLAARATAQPPAFQNFSGPAATQLNKMYGNYRAAPSYERKSPTPSGIPPASSGAGFGLSSSSRASKPFSSVTSQPTVSPYMNLFRVDLNGNNNFNYSTLVRPQLQQQQVNRQVEMQNQQNNRRIQAIAAQANYNVEGSKDQAPTGHQTAFGYTGRYFPAPRLGKRSQ